MDDRMDGGTDPTTRAAVAVLERIFGRVDPGIRYRLWDGTEGSVGVPDGSFTIVIRDREAFGRAFASKNTQAMAEAFADNRVDVEGDLFACLRIGNQLENSTIGWRDKLAIWRALRQVAA
jgi:hypothetical protein